jgi:hypothetical protein
MKDLKQETIELAEGSAEKPETNLNNFEEKSE